MLLQRILDFYGITIILDSYIIVLNFLGEVNMFISLNQRQKLSKHFKYLKEHNPYFSNLLKDRGEDDFLEENIYKIYNSIVPISKEEIMNNFPNYVCPQFRSNFNNDDDMLSNLLDVTRLNYNHEKTVYSIDGSRKWYLEATTGTTGKPFPMIKTVQDRMIEAAYLLKYRKRVSKKVDISNGFLLTHQTDPFLQNVNYREKEEAFEIVFDHMLEKKPSWMFTTALLLKTYVNYIIQSNKMNQLKNIHFDFIESTSQTLLEEEKRQIEELFQTRIINNYGTREVWNIAYECPNNRLHLNTDYLIVDLIDENGNLINEEGVLGEVIITSLTNKTLPLIKYYLGDLAKIYYSKCTCDTNTPVIELEEGRKSERLVNTRHYGNVVFRKVLRGIHFHTNHNHINKIKIIQDDDFHLTVYLDKDRNDDDFEQNFLEICNITIEEFGLFSVNFCYKYPDNFTNSVYKEQIFTSLIGR